MHQNENVKYIQIIKGTITGAICLVLTVLVFTLVIYSKNIDEKKYIPLLIVSSALSGFVSGYTSTRKLRKNGLISGITSTIMPVLLLLIAMTAANKQFNILMLIPVGIILLTGAIGGIAAVNIKRKTKKK